MLEYVESRMSYVAPNLSAILGSTVAAKVMGMCNIHVISTQCIILYLCKEIYMYMYLISCVTFTCKLVFSV